MALLMMLDFVWNVLYKDATPLCQGHMNTGIIYFNKLLNFDSAYVLFVAMQMVSLLWFFYPLS